MYSFRRNCSIFCYSHRACQASGLWLWEGRQQTCVRVRGIFMCSLLVEGQADWHTMCGEAKEKFAQMHSSYTTQVAILFSFLDCIPFQKSSSRIRSSSTVLFVLLHSSDFWETHLPLTYCHVCLTSVLEHPLCSWHNKFGSFVAAECVWFLLSSPWFIRG